MPDAALPDLLTLRKEYGTPARSVVVVRPGMALAMYDGRPLHQMADAITALVNAYLDFIPPGSITALCGVNAWGAFSRARLDRQLKQLRNSRADYTNINLGSGDVLASVGPYGWHLDGGNLSNPSRPNNSNVVYFHFPWDLLDTISPEQARAWVAHVAGITPFESGQFGYAFLQLQRTWTYEADLFVGQHAMRFRGLDILEPDLAREARGLVPNCSWLTLLGPSIVQALGGVEVMTNAVAGDAGVTAAGAGVMLQAGVRPAIGDQEHPPDGLGPVRAVARLTRPCRVTKPVLFYGSDDFNRQWVHRFDA